VGEKEYMEGRDSVRARLDEMFQTGKYETGRVDEHRLPGGVRTSGKEVAFAAAVPDDVPVEEMHKYVKPFDPSQLASQGRGMLPPLA
jgi:hypothetical protein